MLPSGVHRDAASPAAAVTAAAALPLEAIDLLHLDVLDRVVDRYELFRRLRAERPVAWMPEHEMAGFPKGPGYWAVTRFDDVRAVSRDPETYSSASGYLIPDLPVEIGEFYGSILHMDAPRHTRLRLIVNRSFTPRQIARIDDAVEYKAAQLVERARSLGEFDFVEQIAAPFPLEIICEMMGIPPSLWPTVLRCSNIILGVGDPEFDIDFDGLVATSLEIAALAEEQAKDRLVNPGDDLTTALMHAEVDGQRLTAAEFASFFILLVVAGNETTRNAASHGIWQLALDPAARAHWSSDIDAVTPTAVEEIVRYSSPVMHMRRTATRATMLGDQAIGAGDKVVLWFTSANRDETAFADPDRFDIDRTPNDHAGFGSGGPHFCLGANLARRELSVLFRQLLVALPNLEVTAEPAWLRSSFINGIRHLAVRSR
jgi:cytochrome P450